MKSLVFPVITRALLGAEDLPPSQRADLYEGIAECLAAKFPTEARAAADTAQSLREAEHLQMELRLLLKA